MKKKILAIQADPLSSINIKTDTTFLLALEAQKLSFKIYWYETKNLSYENGKVYVDAKEVIFFKNKKKYYEKIIRYDKKNKFFVIDNEIISPNNTLKKNINSIYKFNKLKDKSIIEISPSGEECLKKLSSVLLKYNGLLILIDYGSFVNKGHSTIQSVKNHKKTNLFENIGEQDITYMIDFSYYKRLFESLTLKAYGPFTQKDFLKSIGINELKDKLIKKTPENKTANIESGLKRLIDNNEMGNLFKVLIVSSEKLENYEK